MLIIILFYLLSLIILIIDSFSSFISIFLTIILLVLSIIRDSIEYLKNKDSQQDLFQDLYNLFKYGNGGSFPKDIKNKIHQIGIKVFEEVLNIKYFDIKDDKIIEIGNDKWKIDILDDYEGFVSIHKLGSNLEYFYNGEKPYGDDVKKGFLKYFKKCCKEHKIEIKDKLKI